MTSRPRVTDADYTRLLRLRTRLRKFEHWSAEQAGTMGLTASQHQLLLAIRGHGGQDAPTIGDVADYLLVRHNTAVELVNRTQELGLIDRQRDGADHRVVRLSLTDEGLKRLNALSADHLEELARLAAVVDELFDTLHRT
ncbi:MAG TPA: MarR family transcriptional regulator [Flexivirga sp.]|uniref:MarR family winged helix-turn-helix transcriptional regulator n=1 Tax=Flexivirga sp. TaxID=1962927 RepID=UPI002C660658|nr:MarR family transcriptional regulator [Flexivirga sp.]HWC24524.1 MarR family transcriptional regulator [Flexivirga sp.]